MPPRPLAFKPTSHRYEEPSLIRASPSSSSFDVPSYSPAPLLCSTLLCLLCSTLLCFLCLDVPLLCSTLSLCSASCCLLQNWLQNWQQKGMYKRMCCAVLWNVSVCVWRRLAARLIRLGVWKGVERRTSPYRLKKYAPLFQFEYSFNIIYSLVIYHLLPRQELTLIFVSSETRFLVTKK